MAETKNITMKEYNGVDYDTLYPQTKGENVISPVPVTSGGTGGATAQAGMKNLISALSDGELQNLDEIAFLDVSDNTAKSIDIETAAKNFADIGGYTKATYGYYVGTGLYGQSNPNVLTFDFEPNSLFINATGLNYHMAATGKIDKFNPISGNTWNFTWNDNSVEWYSSGSNIQAAMQFNQADRTYYYLALGGGGSKINIPSGSVLLYEKYSTNNSSGTFVVPKTGNYYLEIHGYGGNYLSSEYYIRNGGYSGQKYDSIQLTEGQSISWSMSPMGNAGSTTFGAYSIQNGGNATQNADGTSYGDLGMDRNKSALATGGNGGLVIGSSITEPTPGSIYLKYLGA